VKLNTGGVNPIVIARDRALDAVEDPDAGGERDQFFKIGDIKGESTDIRHLGIAEDPDAGGEVVERSKSPSSEEEEKTQRFAGDVMRGSQPGAEKGYIGETEKNLDFSSSDPEEGGEVFSRIRPRPPFGQEIPAGSLGEQVTPIDDGGETFSEVKFKIEPAYLKFGEYKAEPEFKPEGDIKGEGGIKFDGPKFDDTYKAESITPPTALRDPDDGGELTREVQPGTGRPYIGETEKDLRSFSSDPEEGGESDEEFFKVKLEDLRLTPAAPGGVPIPYPLDDGPGDNNDAGAADWIARKAGKGQQEFLEVKMSEAFISRGAVDEDETLDDETGVASWIARGKGTTKGFKRDEVSEALDSQEASSEIGGDSQDDDDFESSSLLDLKPVPTATEMLPGLAGELPADADLELELDDDLDDTDESEL
jgi:hypothetical protein